MILVVVFFSINKPHLSYHYTQGDRDRGQETDVEKHMYCRHGTRQGDIGGEAAATGRHRETKARGERSKETDTEKQRQRDKEKVTVRQKQKDKRRKIGAKRQTQKYRGRETDAEIQR
jgi:hypothetical protein